MSGPYREAPPTGLAKQLKEEAARVRARHDIERARRAEELWPEVERKCRESAARGCYALFLATDELAGASPETLMTIAKRHGLEATFGPSYSEGRYGIRFTWDGKQ